jgi:hypothetical protein
MLSARCSYGVHTVHLTQCCPLSRGRLHYKPQAAPPKKSRRKMLKRALFLALVLTSCDVKRLTYANEYSIAISHKVGSEWDS